MARPSFHDLTPAQQLAFGNGVGPYWLPDGLRAWITGAASWFFEDASWRHHDFGYAVGGDRWDRARCDWRFLGAMVRDAFSQEGRGWPVKVAAALGIALVFYACVRVFGGCGSFRYGSRYASLAEVVALAAR